MTLCASCGGEYADGALQCPHCRAINHAFLPKPNEVVPLSDINTESTARLVSGAFWDPIFGEPPGMALGSVNAIGSLPGAGKSTIAQMMCNAIGLQGKRSLYLYSEGAKEDIARSAKRMKLAALDKILVCAQVNPAEAWLERVLNSYKPQLLVIDSLSMLITNLEQQARYSMVVKKACMKANIPALVIIHVTKQEDFAGLMKTQHAVDGLFGLLEHPRREHVLEFQAMGKNRNGPTNRKILLRMTKTGLEVIPDDPPKKKKGKDNANAKTA